MMRLRILAAIAAAAFGPGCAVHAGTDEARDGYAYNGDVRIHYTAMGSGPLMLFIHGFPDIWYTWRQQMEAFSGDYHTVAMDLRGYNLSDAPEGVENYFYDNLVGDVLAVIHEVGDEQAIIVAHDWGAAIAWRLATLHPDVVQRLVILSVPHPGGLSREVQRRGAGLSYADRFIAEGAEANFPPEWLSGWVTDPEVREVYLQTFRRSDIRAMLNYYRANFRSASEPGDAAASRNTIDWVPVRSPVLVIFGEADPYLPVNGLNGTWDYVDNDLRLDIIQNAGHFIQQEAPDRVTRSIRSWLADK